KVFVFDGVPGVPPGTRVPLNQDLNFDLELLSPGGGPTVERRWLLSDGTAKGINVGPGLFADPSHSVISLSGVAPGDAVTMLIDAWAGNYSTFLAAASAGAAASRGLPFTMVAGSVQSPPASLEGMPELSVGIIPEPGVCSIAILGLACFLLNSTRL